MPAASVVERAEFRAARAGCRSKGHHAAVTGAAHGAEPADPARLLPRSRSALTRRATGGAQSPTNLVCAGRWREIFSAGPWSRLTTSIDLEHSFGPAYLRGWLRQGQRALAVVGVNDEETQPTVDGALTCGILWLEACRAGAAGASAWSKGWRLICAERVRWL
jgi:hypothetical protein